MVLLWFVEIIRVQRNHIELCWNKQNHTNSLTHTHTFEVRMVWRRSKKKTQVRVWTRCSVQLNQFCPQSAVCLSVKPLAQHLHQLINHCEPDFIQAFFTSCKRIFTKGIQGWSEQTTKLISYSIEFSLWFSIWQPIYSNATVWHSWNQTHANFISSFVACVDRIHSIRWFCYLVWIKSIAIHSVWYKFA